MQGTGGAEDAVALEDPVFAAVPPQKAARIMKNLFNGKDKNFNDLII